MSVILPIPDDLPPNTDITKLKPHTTQNGTVTSWVIRPATQPFRIGKKKVSALKILLMMLPALLVLVGSFTAWLICYLNIPYRATVNLKFKDELVASKNIEASQLRTIETNFSYTAKMDSTGTKLVPDKTATGRVEFASATAATLPSGYVISKIGEVEYKLTQAVTIGGCDALSGRCNPAFGQVTASLPGARGNTKLGGYYLSNGVAVRGGTINGGTDTPIKTVSEQDLENLKTELIRQMTEKIGTEIQTKLPIGYRQVENSLLVAEQIFTSSARVGDESDNASGTLKISVRFSAYNPDELVKTAGGTTFKTFEALPGGDYKLTYGMPVKKEPVLKILKEFSGGRAEYLELLKKISARQEVEAFGAALIPEDFNGKLVIVGGE